MVRFRTLLTLPLFILIGYIMEWILKDTDFEVKNVAKEKRLLRNNNKKEDEEL